jgi:pimeloyl-ACP methyl ester carboxylesterase
MTKQLEPCLIQYPAYCADLHTRVLQSPGSGPKVLCLHGLGARADRWKTTLPALAAQGYDAYAIDLPGHGFASKGVQIPASIPALADFVSKFCDTMGWMDLHLIGTSLGGHIAAYLALHDPKRFRSLVLVGSLGLIPIGPEVGQMIRNSVGQTSRERIAAKIAMVFANADVVGPEFLEEEFQINNSRGACESFEALGNYIAQGLDTHVVGPQLAQLEQRPAIMLVWGALDKVVPLSVGQQAKSLLPGVELVEIAGAGHAPYMEQPAIFQNAVRNFFAGK